MAEPDAEFSALRFCSQTFVSGGIWVRAGAAKNRPWQVAHACGGSRRAKCLRSENGRTLRRMTKRPKARPAAVLGSLKSPTGHHPERIFFSNHLATLVELLLFWYFKKSVLESHNGAHSIENML